jgi:hypothetical protein
MICSACGGRVKIIGFVTQKAEIFRILRGMGWPPQCHEFDPLEDFPEWSVSQLFPDTPDGFPEIGSQESSDPIYYSLQEGGTGRDIPSVHCEYPESYCDPPHEEVYVDRPHEWD